MLPGERSKLARMAKQSEGELPSLAPLSEALPLSLSLPSPSSATSTPLPVRTSKQRAALRVREVDQLQAVLSYDGYRQNPLAVMREHIQQMMAKEASEGGRPERTNRGMKRAPSQDAAPHAKPHTTATAWPKGKRRRTT